MEPGEPLLLRGGRIYPLDGDVRPVDAILFEGGRVAAVGDASTVGDEAADGRTVDLDGGVVFPGFNDAHTHLLMTGHEALGVDLGGSRSKAEVLDRLADHAADRDPGTWVLGYYLDESDWETGGADLPTRADLDSVSDRHPVAATRIDGHATYVNSVALDRIDIEGVEDCVRTDADGRPTGVLVEEAVGRVRRATAPDRERAREALDRAVALAHSHGITSAQEMAALTTPTERGNPFHRAIFDAWRADELALRFTLYVHADQAGSVAGLELPAGFGDEWLRIGGVKRFADGSLGAGTAKMYEPFADDPDNRGEWVMPPDELTEGFRLGADHDHQLATHALGDEAIDAVIDGYEAVLDEYSIPEPRPRIEHVELASDEALERMASLGIIASMQPNFLQWDEPDSTYETKLGPDAVGANNRLADVLAAGGRLALGSDTMPVGPLFGIHHAVNSDHPAQRLTVEQAIRGYTRGSAIAEHTESFKGTLAPGRVADAVVLDADPFDNPGAIRDFDVVATVVGGNLVYEDW